MLVFMYVCVYNSVKIGMIASWFVLESEDQNFCCVILGKLLSEFFIILGCYYHLLDILK